ncbi:hypothetical protein FOZ63_023690, partial [Perkinsus olseni]
MLGKGMGDNARFLALYTQMKEHFKVVEESSRAKGENNALVEVVDRKVEDTLEVPPTPSWFPAN